MTSQTTLSPQPARTTSGLIPTWYTNTAAHTRRHDAARHVRIAVLSPQRRTPARACCNIFQDCSGALDAQLCVGGVRAPMPGTEAESYGRLGVRGRFA